MARTPSYTINPPSYTKLDENGQDLSASATSWAMVRDNVTGLIWEAKTDDGQHPRQGRLPITGQDAQDGLINQLNIEKFGRFHDDWRLPTPRELESLIHMRTAASTQRSRPAYFPKYQGSGVYWTSVDSLYRCPRVGPG